MIFEELDILVFNITWNLPPAFASWGMGWENGVNIWEKQVAYCCLFGFYFLVVLCCSGEENEVILWWRRECEEAYGF